MNTCKPFQRFRLWILWLPFFTGFGFGVPVPAGEDSNFPLSLQDINDARDLILSPEVDFTKRLELASSFTKILEKTNRSQQARLLCLDFFSSIASLIESVKEEKTAPSLQKPYTEYAQEIDQGKRLATMKKIIESLGPEGKTPPPPALSLLALKADDMLTAYYALYADVANRQLTPYGYYVLGILSARQSRFVEAARFLDRVQENLGSAILERWLAIDQVKMAIVNQNLGKADTIIEDLLKKNANDVQALKFKILYFLETGKEDPARQLLARIKPLLYEDPYLLAETASLAMRLNEIATAASILESFENKIEPNRDFYQALVNLRKAQGKTEEAAKYLDKANQVQDTRVAVGGLLPKNEQDQLMKLLASARDKRRKEIESLGGVDSLATAYLFLLEQDYGNAVQAIEKVLKTPGAHTMERFVLAALQRRSGQYKEAAQNLEAVKKNQPTFRAYQVLTLLADLSMRAGDAQAAKGYYQELLNRFPESYQAVAAKRYLENKSPSTSNEFLQKIKISPMMSRYAEYAAPYVISEIMNYWGDRVSFISINNRLGTSPRRGLLFHEFFAVFFSGTRYKVVPFVGTAEVLLETLKQSIPVVFCDGEMFSNQRMNSLSLIVGADPDRGVFYAEGVSPSDPAILTESQILEGICMAVHPGTLSETQTEEFKKSVAFGEEYMLLNAAAAMIRQQKADVDPKPFNTRLQTIQKETSRGFVPHQLAFARWLIHSASDASVGYFLEAIRPNCAGTAQYWFQLADVDFQHKDAEQALGDLNQALKISPDAPRYELARVLVLYKQGKIADAVRISESLRDQYPDEATVSAHLIALYKKTGAADKMKAEETRLKNLLHLDSIEIDLDGVTAKSAAGKPAESKAASGGTQSSTQKPAAGKPAATPKKPAAKPPTKKSAPATKKE